MKAIQITFFQICIISSSGLLSVCTGQEQRIIYTASFTKTLQKAGIDLYEPAESWLHVVPEVDDGIMHCDLTLQNDRNDFEVRYRIRRFKGQWKKIPQHVEVGRLLTSIASNLPDAEVQVQVPDRLFLDTLYNADEGVFARFIPKMSFSEKPYGSFISLYADGQAAIDIVLLYYDPEYSALESFGNLRFK